MSEINFQSIENWLDRHPNFSLPYVKRQLNFNLVYGWLQEHGYSIASADINNGNHNLKDGFDQVKDVSKNKKKERPGLWLESNFIMNPKAKIQLIFLAHNSVRSDLKEKILKLEQEGDYAFLLDSVREFFSVSDVKELFQLVADNLSIVLPANDVSMFLLREGDKNEENGFISEAFGDRKKNWSEAICSFVALTGAIVDLQIPYEPSEFDKVVDEAVVRETDSVLCLPVMNNSQKIMAVLKVVNRSDGDCFTKEDRKIEAWIGENHLTSFHTGEFYINQKDGYLMIIGFWYNHQFVDKTPD